MSELNLAELCQSLGSELAGSNKSDTADYFFDLAKKFSSREKQESIDAARELRTSGAIVQYAGFSDRQIQIFDQIQEKAKLILES
ncbi:hypothetical protein KPG71_18025 [Roseovarius sp. PS-C2]|uniref:hypothetical protein n=1 Tax=Roseovarius sp. PS-C2 TaxID=2820814 RepID=UPI001C0CCB91|nr:hypothetical protein [Roseovarius sp. PS-C2]MBU3261924.1 hypothetical protein [Roseovarius sp. PS-C2]